MEPRCFKKLRNLDLNRRQLMHMGFATTAALALGELADVAAYARPDGTWPQTPFKAVAFNHIDYRVADYAKVRDFYVNLFSVKTVWDDGKQCSVEFGDPPNAIYIRPLTQALDRPPGEGPSAHWTEQMGQGNVGHLAVSIENFQLDQVKAELERRGLRPQPDGPYAWSIFDPSGFLLQICATRGVFPGQASPTAKQSDGTNDLGRLPGPDGKGFKAYAVSHCVLMVPDVDAARDFYTGLLGMRLIYYRPGDAPGVDRSGGPVCFLRFGENTLYLRKSLHPQNKPYVAHFALAVENFDRAAVKAELERRGYKPEPDSKYAWTIRDPAGMRVEVAGKGMPEHVGADCNGENQGCPGGPDK
jgi:catechol 2,3-dioxygenase-like lactoylglutathione lyase family enzyme